ncbi:Holliday junction resolvase RuvX [Candidatus Falkowbacteria bacterium CG10_big_fil_rev_8_21_14_0_10_39_9]|uniref:Putative pre-16S rRNA nuclease n=1 Tax=Candidatus Falkowbacteria bacterium CG10_big_fil_rev_8_21_14_0_10_39_9 TaxID=1974566 RepID=A0A2M6WNQ3_9BACT|nr:MAG: Holliday junction resolvase RuvX [Candidatus Falkowbacteria bacterium CG10_big_fil_rev_8_21_14_0_10_39_9]
MKNIRLIGIDWGEKRLGVALAESEVCLATPFMVAANLSELLHIITAEKIDLIVLGEPQKMRGKTNDINPQFKEFLRLLKTKTDLRIELIDERLSSKNVDALVGSKKTKAPRDAVAAMIILQSYLDQTYGRNL